MEQMIAKMRADFAVVAENRRAVGEWSPEDEKDIGLAIKAAVDSRDPDMVACWARWLADLSAAICAWSLIVRGAEGRMREQARVERQKREGKAA